MLNLTLKTKRTLILLLSVALLICIGISSQAYARQHKGGQNPMREMMQQLDLTDAQRDQVRALMQQKKQNKPDRGQREQMHAQMLAVVSAPDFNQQAAADLAEQMASKMKQRMLQRMETHHAIYQILDDQQRSKFVELMQQRRNMMESKGPGRGNR